MCSLILAHPRGRLRRRAEGGAGSGVLRLAARNRWPREVRDPARQALRPGCEELAVQIRKKCRRWKRGPRPKIATVELFRKSSGVRWSPMEPTSDCNAAIFLYGPPGRSIVLCSAVRELSGTSEP